MITPELHKRWLEVSGQDKINIQEIKENESPNHRADTNQENINLLIKAMKQLDDEVKEIKRKLGD